MSFISAKYEISRLQSFAIVFFCLLLICLNLFLLKQNQDSKQLIQISCESSITIGTKFLMLNGVDMSGNKVEVNLYG
jgi:hypothetical protein